MARLYSAAMYLPGDSDEHVRELEQKQREALVNIAKAHGVELSLDADVNVDWATFTFPGPAMLDGKLTAEECARSGRELDHWVRRITVDVL